MSRQTLAEHSKKVSEKCADTCKHSGFENLGRLAGLIHDEAKAYETWQRYLNSGGETVFHAPYCVEFIERCFGAIEAPCAELTRQMLGIAVRAHHGGLHDALTPSGEKDLPGSSAYSDEETVRADKSFFEEVATRPELESLFRLACAEVEALLKTSISIAKEPKVMQTERQTMANEAMLYMGLAERLLYSALIDADRLDAACREAGIPMPREAAPDFGAMLRNLERKLEKFSREGIGALRSEISRQCGEFDAPCGVYRLFAPTGGSKTLSSLRLALTIAKKYGKRRIIYAEPYLTILSQAANEIRSAIGEAEDADTFESAVLEFHSNVVFEDSDEGEEQERFYSRLTERLAAPIVLTSTVQLLNALFSGKSAAARRFAALSNSVIIIDEVQAIPTNSTYLFSIAVNFLARFCGCLVVLCTATPPALESIKYPVRMSPKQDIVGGIPELFAAFKRTSIVPVEGKMTVSGMSEFVTEKLDEHGNCLVIVNTKSMARKLFTAVTASKPEYGIFYLSTELCPANRDEILTNIKKQLPNEKILVISTQLIEAGVDISFKCVIRSFAGLDSIIQAAGRCNRHKETDMGTVYVVDCEEELSMLPDIKEGKRISLELTAMFAGRDLSSPESVRRYYEEYFLRKQPRLDYQIKEAGLASELLGNNPHARKEYGEQFNTRYSPNLLAQSFRTVGREYKPISDNTTGIVTPFGNSAELIEKLKADKGGKKRHYLHALQKYCVNVFDNRLQKLLKAGAVSFDKEEGIWILARDAYSKITGIDSSMQESIDNYIL